jgi:ABC-2 type transport system permease protein
VGQKGVWASIVFPQNFSHSVVNTALSASAGRTMEYNNRTIHLVPSEGIEGPRATLRLDDSNPVIAKDVLLGLKDAFSAMLAGQQEALSADSVLTVDSVYGGTVRMMDYTAPGVIGFAMTLITVLLTSVSIVRERTGGTLTRLLIAPIRPWQVTLGYTTAFVAIALFQVGELFLVSSLLFSIRIVGSLGLIALIIVLFAIGLQGIATLVSTAARNEFQAMQFLLFLIIPSLMLSGVFWPIEALPQSMRYASYISPLTFANNALREVMLKGGGWNEIAFDIAVLGGFAAVMLGFAVVSMKRQAYSA